MTHTTSLSAIEAEVLAANPDAETWLRGPITGSTEAESAAIGFLAIREFSRTGDYRGLVPISIRSDSSFLDSFQQRAVVPVFDYLGESLDDVQLVLSLLVRYKHHREWFSGRRLFNMWEADKGRGEKLLALDLYEFLFDQGVEFSIEPASASGEADLISSQSGPDRLVADAKIFNPTESKGKTYLVKGFHQLHRYACDYNQPCGYLVIFNTSDTLLSFDAETDVVPRVQVGQKTIFFVVVDIFPHEASASKRPPPKIVKIESSDILRVETGLQENSSYQL